MRAFVLLLVLAVLLPACTLEAGSYVITVLPKPDVVTIPTATPTPIIPTPITTTPPTPTATQPAPACTIQTSWPIYIVQAGDSLASIARRVGSTVSALTTANCLQNPNTIYVGQQLRVPNAPMPAPARVVAFQVINLPTGPGQPQMHAVEWSTTGAASVMITVTPFYGTNGQYVGTYGPTGSVNLPSLQPYAPEAFVNLYLLDASGREIVDSSGNIIGVSARVLVSGVNDGIQSFDFYPNPVEAGGALTLNWQANAGARAAIHVIRADRDHGEMVTNDAPISGSLTTIVPSDYAATIIQYELAIFTADNALVDHRMISVGVTNPNTGPDSGCVLRHYWAVYTVEPGDTLTSLAGQLGISVEELKLANCLTSDTINAGQNLYVPFIPSPVCEPRIDWPLHIIRTWDTPEHLAAIGGVTINDLWIGNCWVNLGRFAPGEPMRVPVLPPA